MVNIWFLIRISMNVLVEMDLLIRHTISMSRNPIQNHKWFIGFIITNIYIYLNYITIPIGKYSLLTNETYFINLRSHDGNKIICKSHQYLKRLIKYKSSMIVKAWRNISLYFMLFASYSQSFAYNSILHWFRVGN